MRVKWNGQRRELVMFANLSTKQQQDFDYIRVDEFYDPRFFEYRGSIYDCREFQVTPGVSELNSLGWQGWQPESYFSAVVVKVFDSETNILFEDEIVVGYAHW